MTSRSEIIGNDRKGQRIEEAKPRNSDLSLDLIGDILSRLPVESLLRFRCVAESYSSLISSPHFVKTHLRLSLNNKERTYDRVMSSASAGSKILIEATLVSLFHEEQHEDYQSDAVIDLSDRLISDGLLNELPKNPVVILGSINGLVGLSFRNVGIFVWNPTTREFNVLAYPDASLLFSEIKTYGFGYDRFQDDYKIVGTFYNKNIPELKMYSLNNDSWKSIVDYKGPLLTGFGKYLEGKLHWPSAARENGEIMYEGWSIVSFDLATEQWQLVEQPTYDEESEDVVFHLGVLENNLAIFRESDYTHVDVWILKEYGVKESWTKLFVIKYRQDFVDEYWETHVFSLPCFLMSNVGEILVMIDKESMTYNIDEESFRPSKVIAFGSDEGTQSYFESLISPFPRAREDAETS